MATKMEDDPNLYGDKRQQVEELWFSNDELRKTFDGGHNRFMTAMREIISGVAQHQIKDLENIEPISQLTELGFRPRLFRIPLVDLDVTGLFLQRKIKADTHIRVLRANLLADLSGFLAGLHHGEITHQFTHP